MTQRPFMLENFLAMVDKDGDGGCWIWTGARFKTGGRFGQGGYGKYNGRSAHRALYKFLHGGLSDDLQLDHLCRVPACVNPEHLEPVTASENVRRHWSTYTTCAHGHEFTDENTYRAPSGRRDCRACGRERVRRYQDRRARAKEMG